MSVHIGLSCDFGRRDVNIVGWFGHCSVPANDKHTLDRECSDVGDGTVRVERLSPCHSDNGLGPILVVDWVGREPGFLRWRRIVPDSQEERIFVDFLEVPNLTIDAEEPCDDFNWVNADVFARREYLMHLEGIILSVERAESKRVPKIEF